MRVCCVLAIAALSLTGCKREPDTGRANSEVVAGASLNALLPEGDYAGTFESRSSDSPEIGTGTNGYTIHWTSHDKVELASWVASDGLQADGWSAWVFSGDSKFDILGPDDVRTGTGEVRDGAFHVHQEGAGLVTDEVMRVSGSTMVVERIRVVTANAGTKRTSKAVLEKQPE